MKNKIIPFGIRILIAIAAILPEQVCAQDSKDKSELISVKDSIVANKKEEKNRNVMLNADNSSGPRSVNIGLPFNGDIIILENEVPVVYWFWPTIPTVAWRYDSSLSKMGLLSFAEGALTFGKVGFAVQSSDRDASSSFKGYAQVYGNSHGTSRYDVSITGPLNKKGWGYTLSAYEAFDRGNGVNFMFAPWYDRTEMFKVGLQKKYNKGNVRLLFKYADVRQMMSNYQPLTYDGNGKTTPLDNFKLGGDSYVVRDGLVPYYDPITGEAKQANLADDNFSRSFSRSLYLTGDHKFDNGWKLKYSSMYQTANSPVAIQVPITLMSYDTDQQGNDKYYYSGTNKQYTGKVQYVLNQLIPQSDVTTWITRIETTKKINNHDLRFGFTHQYNHSNYSSYSGMYVQTIEPNPRILDYHAYNSTYNMNINYSNQYGGLPYQYSGFGTVDNFKHNKTALYVSDDIKLNNTLNIGLGGRLERQNIWENKNTVTQDFIKDTPFVEHTFKNQFNKVGIASFVQKLTRDFGLLGDITYNSYYENYWDYPVRNDLGVPVSDADGHIRQTVPKENQIVVLNFGGGVYYNYKDALSLVSKVTRISKENIRSSSATITDPVTGTRANFDPIFYDISTMGWSTDVVATPFKNFTFHYLLTLQKPQYKNYSYGAFGVNYNYSNNTIPELSKVLMEFDPSYSFMNGALRAWFSLRYFGPQTANATNAFNYDARWENFGGLDYKMSRNVQFKLQVTNFLNQAGVKGMIQGGDQITSDANYIGRTIVAGGIRPRTIELTAIFKF